MEKDNILSLGSKYDENREITPRATTHSGEYQCRLTTTWLCVTVLHFVPKGAAVFQPHPSLSHACKHQLLGAS
ncbi:hypothetical protein RRG08_056737 [Elysia crispata]|uniref:Uncharacterized protein n=1 Tax=Elysia crispata TaxID=231223 RepID=A0AAE0ZR81_9GAST|nr:hypothetical protein RRG08_056737 [Elysia crispata]